MPENFLDQIKSQKALSDGLVQALLPVVQEMYYPGIPASEIRFGDLGSFARGTNTDSSPDLDIAFLNAPHDEARGHKDWTPLGTFELTGNKEGFTTLVELESHDPMVVRFIRRILPIVEAYFSGSARFNYLRTWVGYPGLVFNISLPHPVYGEIALDINFVYETTHFGIEHCRRFNAYFDRVASALGPDVAERLIRDIKAVKLAAKKLATDSTGWVDRKKKVPGFIVEALFCSRFPPYTCDELMKLIHEYHWKSTEILRDRSVGDQYDQILDAGFSFGDLLRDMAIDNYSLTRGGWETLLHVAQEFTIDSTGEPRG
jgi:hypothetical protein